jgi:O-antigen/teichoic acid export membrane protein
MIGEIVPRLLNFLLLPIMTRYLTPADYGVIGYVDSIILFVFIFSVFSLNVFLIREYFDLDSFQSKKKLIGNFFIILIAYNFFLFFIVFGLFYFSFQFLETQFPIVPFLTIALVCNFLEIFCLFPQIIYRVQERALSYVYFASSKTLFHVIAVIFFLHFYYEDHGPIVKYYGVLLPCFIYALLSFYIVKKNAIFSFNFSQIKEGILFAMPLVLGALSICIIDVSDRIILENYVSMKDIGIYSIAYALGFGINIIIKGSYKAFEPLIYKNSKDHNFLTFFTAIKNEYYALIFVSCLFVVFFSKEIVIFILPDTYYSAHTLIPIIVLAGFAKGIYTMQSMLLMIEKKTKVISKIMMLGAALNVLVNLLFIEYFGVIIAAISTLLSFLLMAFLVHKESFKYYQLSFQPESKDYLPLVVLALIVYLLYFYLDVSIGLYSTLIKMFLLTVISFIYLKVNGSNFFKSGT